MGHQSYVLLCTETTLSNPPVVQPKSSCDVHLLRSPWIILPFLSRERERDELELELELLDEPLDEDELLLDEPLELLELSRRLFLELRSDRRSLSSLSRLEDPRSFNEFITCFHES